MGKLVPGNAYMYFERCRNIRITVKYGQCFFIEKKFPELNKGSGTEQLWKG